MGKHCITLRLCIFKGITKVYAIESTDCGATWNECYGNRSNALEVFVTDTLLKASSNRYTEYDDSQGLGCQVCV